MTNEITMYDAVNITNIPKGAAAVGGYVNGKYQTFKAVCNRFPRAYNISIDVNGSGIADVLDVERYDATPEMAPAWAKRMRALGRIATVYCNAVTFPKVRAAFLAAKEPEPYYWIADWTNNPHLYPSSVSTQWADGTKTYPGKAIGTDTTLAMTTWLDAVKFHNRKKPGLHKAVPQAVNRIIVLIQAYLRRWN